MKKICKFFNFVALLMATVLISSCNGASEKDFYGTWKNNYIDEENDECIETFSFSPNGGFTETMSFISDGEEYLLYTINGDWSLADSNPSGYVACIKTIYNLSSLNVDNGYDYSEMYELFEDFNKNVKAKNKSLKHADIVFGYFVKSIDSDTMIIDGEDGGVAVYHKQ